MIRSERHFKASAGNLWQCEGRGDVLQSVRGELAVCMEKQQYISGRSLHAGIDLIPFTYWSIDYAGEVLCVEPLSRPVHASSVRHNDFVEPFLLLEHGESLGESRSFVQGGDNYGTVDPRSNGVRGSAGFEKLFC